MRIGGMGTTELVVILVIVILLFGVGRVSKIGGEMGTAIREFRKGLRGDDEDQDQPKEKDASSQL
jgi:sec-independent protein translocase protein TatA